MQPIHQLLNRIRWDPDFAKGRFEIAFADHLAPEDVVVPLSTLVFDAERPDMVGVVEKDGMLHHIPLHRIRAVYRDSTVIWQRPDPSSRGVS